MFRFVKTKREYQFSPIINLGDNYWCSRDTRGLGGEILIT